MYAAPLIALLVASWLALDAAPARAQDEAPPSSGAAKAPAPSLDLDRLLKPRTIPALRTRYGGKDRETWTEDFARARNEVAELEQKVADAQEKYRDASDAEWGYSPVGGGMPTDPEVLKIRAEIKRDRQSLEAARRRLRELGVEASLAGVPKDWTAPE